MHSKLAMLFTGLYLLMATDASSQARFGFKAGATFSFPHAGKTTGPPPGGSGYYLPIEGAKGRGGVLLGVFVPFPLSPSLQLRPSAELGFRSVAPKFTAQSGTYGYAHAVNYLDIPVPLTYVVQKKAYKWLMGAGPHVSFLLNPTYQEIAFDKEVDFGVNGYLAYETDIGFSINLQYLYGLTNLASNQDFKNRFLNISLGYLF